ncbi:MAG: hypothetical protein IKC12_02105 [Alistipes sp.]|nr:hypothetical protein [Alistipes sp.]
MSSRHRRGLNPAPLLTPTPATSHCATPQMPRLGMTSLFIPRLLRLIRSIT